MVRQFLIVLVVFLSSCVYTLDIQQGNILDQEDIDKLRGMCCGSILNCNLFMIQLIEDRQILFGTEL